MTFRTRSEPCGDCGGYGYVSEPVRWAGEAYGELVDRICPHCDGAGELDAGCEECGRVEPLNDDLLCERCEDMNTLCIAAFNAKYGNAQRRAA